MDTNKKTAVITGVSSGIGRAIAKALCDEGWRVFGSVRKEKDAETAKEALGENFMPLLFDVTNVSAIRDAASIVSEALEGRTLNALINNAGIAVAGPLRHLPLEELHQQLDINLFGVLRVTQVFAPMLGADPVFKGAPGRIINISSVAGKVASPFLGPYTISKHALEALSTSLRREFLVHGIDVIVVGPGSIQTPIWEKADDINAEAYKETEYYDVLVGLQDVIKKTGEEGLPPEAMGALALNILNDETPKTRYAILKNWLSGWLAPRFLPPRMVDKIIAKRLGMKIKDT